jgi:3-methyladenine DNA glycosylase/8-oxoguanine DNA glycosylase
MEATDAAQRLLVDVPPSFSLSSMLQAGPLPVLPPLVADISQSALQAVLYPRSGEPVEVLVHQIERGVPLFVAGLPESAEVEPLMGQLHAMLGLDEDLSLFYAMAAQDEELAWAGERDAARSLRSPTVFEDIVKCLIASRVAPAGLRPIIEALCRAFGARSNLLRPAFPTAAALAEVPAADLENELSALPGGRAVVRPLQRLAAYCTSGSFYPESLRRAPRRFSEALLGESAAAGDEDDELDEVAEELIERLFEEELEWQFRIERLVARLPGYGPRACDLLLQLLGCYDQPAFDLQTLRAWRQRFSPAQKKDGVKTVRHADPATQALSQSMARRVAPYGIYGRLAQRLLLRGEGA